MAGSSRIRLPIAANADAVSLTLVIPLMAMGVPLVDISFAFLRRISKGKNPFRADRRHLHHRLIDLGLPTRQILFIFYFITAGLGLLSFMLRGAGMALVGINLVLLAIGFILLIDTLRRIRSDGGT